MEAYFTPCDISAIPMAADADEPGLCQNLFRDFVLPRQKEERLQVFLRLRPVPEEPNLPFAIDGTRLLAYPPPTSKAFKSHKGDPQSAIKTFMFNHIFNFDVNQEAFFESCCLPFITRLIRGESSLLFAFGTTNSGKSYTMRGNEENPGVMPRAFNSLFSVLGNRVDQQPVYQASRFSEADYLSRDNIETEMTIRNFICGSVKNKSSTMTSFKNISLSKNTSQIIVDDSLLSHPAKQNTNFSVWVSFVEFYMENIIDLLAISIDGDRQQQLMTVPDGHNNYFVKGLRRVSVSSAEEAFRCLLFGWENLHRASTNLNRDSSRSHCIFTVTLVGHDTVLNRVTQVSNLAFCDLAGSERGDRTQNTGIRIQEAGQINFSIMSLGRCITAIRQNQKRKGNKIIVPFRDSCLTKYFQSYFNGTGQASMIVNINPSKTYFDETIQTLKFSAEASDIVVSTEEVRAKLKDSFMRLTQQWMMSSQRWSQMVGTREQLSDPTLRLEEEDEITETELLALQETVLANEDPDFLKEHIALIESLQARLKAVENEKIDIEFKVRQEVVADMKKIQQRITQERDEEKKLRVQQENDHLIQIQNLRKQHRKEIVEKDKIIKQLETRVADLESQHEVVLEERDRHIHELQKLIEELESENIHLNKKVDYHDADTSVSLPQTTERGTDAVVVISMDAKTSPMKARSTSHKATSPLLGPCKSQSNLRESGLAINDPRLSPPSRVISKPLPDRILGPYSKQNIREKSLDQVESSPQIEVRTKRKATATATESTSQYLQVMKKNENQAKIPSKRKKVVEDLESSIEETIIDEEDELTALTGTDVSAVEPKTARKLRSRRVRTQQASTARKKMPNPDRRILVSSVSPISQEEQSDFVTQSSKMKLRSKRKANRKKPEGKKLKF